MAYNNKGEILKRWHGTADSPKREPYVPNAPRRARQNTGRTVVPSRSGKKKYKYQRAYAKGREAEYKTAHFLQALGFATARSAGSHGYWDICAVNENMTLLVQVKLSRRPDPGAIQQMFNLEVPENTVKLFHVWLRFQSFPDQYVVTDDPENPLMFVYLDANGYEEVTKENSYEMPRPKLED